ncbi:MAG: redoxin family protein [Fimbriimonadaceae bacterium]|nr:redoxin family protein [Fimbriimonadaceae bacterium]
MIQSVFGRLAGVGLSLLMLASASSLAQAQEKAKLQVGQPAPAVKIAKWIKGSKVEMFDKNKVYVVEFWATWCGPCKETIPHLTELAKKFKDKVSFIGVDSFEVDPDEPVVKGENGEPEHFAMVEKFVKDMGAKMDYNVGIDTTDGFMAKNWMDAANQGGIPTAFIVDQAGKLAWIGHPLDDMDKVLEKILAKKWNALAEAKKKADAEEAASKDAAKFMKASELMESGEYKAAVEILDDLYATGPKEARQLIIPMIVDSMVHYDEPGTYARVQKWLDKGELTSASTLNEIAWNMMTEARFKKPNVDLVLKLAEKAVKATDSKDGMIMDTLALAHYKKGNFDKAVDYQTKAVALVKAMVAEMPSVPQQLQDTINEMEARLASFIKAKGG